MDKNCRKLLFQCQGRPHTCSHKRSVSLSQIDSEQVDHKKNYWTLFEAFLHPNQRPEVDLKHYLSNKKDTNPYNITRLV